MNDELKDVLPFILAKLIKIDSQLDYSFVKERFSNSWDGLAVSQKNEALLKLQSAISARKLEYFSKQFPSYKQSVLEHLELEIDSY